MRLDVAPAERGVVEAQVLVTASLTRGRAPDPGIHPATFVWRDVVQRPPPRRRARAGAHVTYHLTEQAPDVRVSFVTHVRVDPGDNLDSPLDDVIHVEERLYVQRRALQELIDREREMSDRLAMRWRSRLNGHLVAQRLRANRIRVAWMLSLVVALIKLEAKAGHAGIRATRSFLRGLVHVPDVILTRTMSARRHLSSRMGRRSILKHLRDPSMASDEEKGILLLLVSGIILTSVLVLSNVFALALPGLAPSYARLTLDAGYALANVFVPIPIPPEVWIVDSFITLGATLGWIGLFSGKALGSWLLYLVGDSLHDSLERQTRTRPRLARAVAWVKRNADRSGFWILFVLNFVPFLPDTLILAFAVSGMRFRPFLGGILLGTLLKYLGLAAAFALVGPETIDGWLSDVGYWVNPVHWF